MVVECANPLAWLSHREFGATASVEKRKIIIDRCLFSLMSSCCLTYLRAQCRFPHESPTFGSCDCALCCRLSKLSLDGETRLQSQAAGGITCLSVDSAEQRYALAAAQDGSIQCFDILGTVRLSCSQAVPKSLQCSNNIYIVRWLQLVGRFGTSSEQLRTLHPQSSGGR